MQTPTIYTALQNAADELKNSSTPRLDAEILLAHTLNVARAYLFAHPEEQINPASFYALIKQRHQGWPLAYLTGEKEFWSLPLQVTPAVLIPRPETELLVELALQKLNHLTACKILDLGTGSGAIALALAHEKPTWEIYATDKSNAALEVARNNAAQLNLKINFKHGEWFTPVTNHQFTAILANPPYVATSDSHLKELAFEPVEALVAGSDGLEALRIIIANAKKYLLPQGWLMVEHGWNQAAVVTQFMQQQNFYAITTHDDLARLPRVTLAQIKG